MVNLRTHIQRGDLYAHPSARLTQGLGAGWRFRVGVLTALITRYDVITGQEVFRIQTRHCHNSSVVDRKRLFCL